MWIWQEAAVGMVVVVVGMMMAFAGELPGPDRLWGPHDPVTGRPTATIRLAGRGLVAMGVGLVLLSWAGTPYGLWAGVVGVVFMVLAVTLNWWAVQLRRSMR